MDNWKSLFTSFWLVVLLETLQLSNGLVEQFWEALGWDGSVLV